MNAGSGIQGMALAIIKVLLRKSSFNKNSLYRKLLKNYKADTIRIEIMKLRIQHFLKPSSSSSYLYYDDEQRSESP